MSKIKSFTVVLFMVIGLLCCFSTGSFGYSYGNSLRVHIGDSSSASVTVSSGSYRYSANGSTVSAGGTVTLSPGNSLSSVDGQGRFKYGGTEYRGDVANFNGNIVNTLSMEQYLYSVVACEIGGYSPADDALKAQAICSRNFACVKKKSPRSSYYDILNNTSDQVYNGYSGENSGTAVAQRIRNAVDATANEVMYYDGTLVSATYMANAGGATEDAGIVWGGNYPYLKGVLCPWDSQPFAGDAGTYVSMKFPTSAQWTVVISFADLANKVTGIGAITDVSVDHTGSIAGYATTVTVTGTNGSKAYKGKDFRSLLGLRSACFDVVIGSSVAGRRAFTAQYIGSSDFAANFAVTGKTLTINGRGYGHNIGMSQWSACVMAYKGYSYFEILNYFFNQGQNNGRLTLAAFH